MHCVWLFLLYPLFHPNEDDLFVIQIVVVDHADVILMQVRFEVFCIFLVIWQFLR
jgi:hypothetical protein